MSETEIITGQVEEYAAFRSQVTELVAANKSIVFDYESDKGEKEARSYIYKMRQSKSAIEKERKGLKSKILERGRQVDGEAKQLVALLDSMIDVHMQPLENKKKREEERIAKITRQIDILKNYKTRRVSGTAAISDTIQMLEETTIKQEHYMEFTEQAENLRLEALDAQRGFLQEAIKVEEERAEREKQAREEKPDPTPSVAAQDSINIELAKAADKAGLLTKEDMHIAFDPAKPGADKTVLHIIPDPRIKAREQLESFVGPDAAQVIVGAIDGGLIPSLCFVEDV